MNIPAHIILPLLLAAVPLSAQAQAPRAPDAQTVQALQNLQKLDQRINAIGYRLVAANAPFCAEQVARAGLMLHDIDQYGDAAAARYALGFGGPIAINAVAPGTPAAEAGLRPGHGLWTINGEQVNSLPIDGSELQGEKPAYRRIAAVNRALARSLAKGPAELAVGTAQEQRMVTITPVMTCPSRFQIEVSQDRNASANGEMVSVSSRLAEYFLDDDEFAAVVAHELSHNLLRHRDRLDAQKVNRGFFGQFGKSAGRIRETEIEADRLSVWLMANAGFDPQAAIRFWTRYGKQHGKGIFSASTHYRWKKRVQLFEEEIAKMQAMEPEAGKYPPPLLAPAP